MNFKEIAETLIDSQSEPIEEALIQAYQKGMIDAIAVPTTPNTRCIRLDVRIRIVENGMRLVEVHSDYAPLPEEIMKSFTDAIEGVVARHQPELLKT